MTIRGRLTLQFMLLASLVLGGMSASIYLLSANYRMQEFEGRLRDRGVSAATLLIQVEEVTEELLRRIERDNPVRLPEEAIRIFDHNGELLFHLGDENLPPVAPELLDQVRLEGEQRSTIGPRERLAFPFNDRYDRFVVVVSGNDIFGRSKLRNLAQVLVATFLAGLLITFLAGRLYAQRALLPLQRLVADLRRFNAQDLAMRVHTGDTKDEIAEVASTFNDLLAKLEEAFHVQKNFIANASHEMRTPLTTISGQLEVLLLKPREKEEYQSALFSVVEDMHALNRLADRLLLLAQAENSTTAATFTPVRMDEVLWQARQEAKRSDTRNIVEVSIGELDDGTDLLVNGNESLLRSMLANLIENACKYSPDHTARVSLAIDGEEVRMEVANHGSGIGSADQERVFEPFFRATNTGGAKGHGIGLSLARRIAELHRGSIVLWSKPDAGARFTVRLPKTG
jgi:signal transduction histidine kinase